MKTVILLNAHPGAPIADLPAALRGSTLARSVSRLVVHIAQQGAAYDAVVEVWSDMPLDLAELSDMAALELHPSREVVGKAGAGPAPVGITPGLSQLSFIRAIEGLARGEVERHWQEHTALACEIHVGMNRYVQDRFDPPGEGAGRWFGMAHLHFPDDAALRDGLFRTPEDIAVITADVAEFVADHATMLAVEHVVKG